jgi:hypothetical protein
MGGLESLNANLNDPKAVSATVMIYGAGFGKIDSKRLERLRSPVLAITGNEDTGAMQSAINFLSSMKEANDRRDAHLSRCGPRLRATTFQ